MTAGTAVRRGARRTDPAGAPVIERVKITLLKIPLKTPYKLAFGDVRAFDTMLAQIVCDGSAGIGEATVLTGYTTETIEGTWHLAQAIAAQLPGQPAEAAKRRIEAHASNAPFTATMFATAIEMAERHPVLDSSAARSVPLVFGVNATDFDEIDAELEEAHAAGFRTAKIKVGFDVQQDLARIRHIQASNGGRAKLRIDANQGYSVSDAMYFARSLEPTDIELLEQPCHREDWDALAAVARVTNVPLMLDESIYEESDIVRAAKIGVGFVKLKLMKFGGLDRLCAGLERIRELGMQPVLGNGVAGDIGCWMEACVARDLIRNAGEMNGFLRSGKSLIKVPLEVSGGAVQLPAKYVPALDDEAVTSLAIASHDYG